MEFESRQYQEEDLPFFLRTPKSGIWYEPRLGKTVLSLRVNAIAGHKTLLIVCRKNGISTWREHVPAVYKQYCPEKSVRVTLVSRENPSATERQQLWRTPRDHDVNVFIVTYGSLLRDWQWLLGRGLTFESIIADEYHKFLLNRKNKSVEMLDKLSMAAKRYHPTSGSPTTQGPANFFPVLRQFNRKFFSSYWRFVNAFYHVIDGPWGKELGQLKNMDVWRATLMRYGRVRTREECAPWMPKVQHRLRHITCSPEQLKLYNSLEKDSYMEGPSGELIVAQTSLEMALRKRQILVCPRILDPQAGIGAAMMDLLDILEEADNPIERHIVVFTPFAEAIPHFRDFLRGQGYHVNILQGGIGPDHQDQQIAEFRAKQGIMLCTTSYAQAFSLTPAIECYHIGYSWDPTDNKQASDRLVSQRGDNPINAWYYCFDDTDDAIMAERVNIRQERISLTTDVSM